jgi:hypothetical protein
MNLKEKIEKLNALLNEYYSVDISWKEVGEWPKDHNGSIMYSGATDDEIAKAEKKSGYKFPPTYKEFLRLCAGWVHCWGDDTFIGTSRPDTKRAQEKIVWYMDWQMVKLRSKFGEKGLAESIKTWEAQAQKNLCLADNLVIATNFRGAAWVFDSRTTDKDGEMKLGFWTMDGGINEDPPPMNNIEGFLDFAIGEVEFRLEDWYKTYPKDKKKKKKTSK